MASFDYAGALSNLGQAFLDKQKLDERNRLATAYARNPAYADAMTNLQQQDRAERLLQKEESRKDALRGLASQITGINPDAQGTLGANNALTQYAQITGDVSPLIEIAKKRQMSTLPSAGGGTGILIDRLMKDNPNLSFEDALFMVQAGTRKGLEVGQGGLAPRAGFGEALGTIGGQEEFGKKSGSLQAELGLKPQIELATQEAQEIGKSRGEGKSKLESMTANMPKLENVVSDLRDLASKATYTTAGQLYDDVRRQTGQLPTEGAVARTKFISKIDNEVLPLLRETFGAAFTVAEGDRLRATMGDENMSPLEKQAALDSFIEAKTGEIGALQSRFGINATSQPKIIKWSDF